MYEIKRKSSAPLETAGDWLERRFKQVNLDASRAFYQTLRTSLPPSVRGSVKIGLGKVSGEVSHGLTSEGMKAAHRAMDRTIRAGFNKMLKDFSKRYFG